MKKFSKINESVSFDKNDIDRVSDILSDFRDESKFNIRVTNMGSNGLTYGKDIPEWMNTFNWFEIIIHYKNDSNSDEFFQEFNIFNKNIQNIISHLESMGIVFYKTKIEHDREYLNERDKKDRFTYKNCHVNLQSTIKVFPN
jgi:hypothetical protein